MSGLTLRKGSFNALPWLPVGILNSPKLAQLLVCTVDRAFQLDQRLLDDRFVPAHTAHVRPMLKAISAFFGVACPALDGRCCVPPGKCQPTTGTHVDSIWEWTVGAQECFSLAAAALNAHHVD